MKERVLNFKRNDDPTIVEDKDGLLTEALGKLYQNMKLNVGFCHEQLTKGQLTVGMKETHLTLAEAYMIDFLDASNYNSILSREKEERHKEIRSLNAENAELRKQLGQKVSNEDVREKLKNLTESFNRWWNIEGFGCCGDEKFVSSGVFQVRLSGMIAEAYRARDSDNETEEKKVEKLRKIGFEIITDDGKNVVDNDKNRELLRTLLKKKYPSVEIFDYRTYCGRKQRNVFREINITIYNLEELK